MHTTLTYLTNSHLTKTSAQCLQTKPMEDGRLSLILDHTIFYPQGGGQPYDQGIIISESGKFSVEEVRYREGMVDHIGRFISGSFTIEQQVTLLIDQKRRHLHSRLHSAGHLIDVALYNMGSPLTPSKGYHFPNGAYCEYTGNVAPEQRDELKKYLEKEIHKMTQEGFEVCTQLTDKKHISQICYFVPEYVTKMPAEKPLRVITVHGQKGFPCGGTHVSNIREVGSVQIPKIKFKNGKVRIRYDIDE